MKKNAPLAEALVDAVRVMRHKGLRIVVSTQLPLTLPEELLELCSAAFLHNFHSEDWFAHLAKKIHLPRNGFARVAAQAPGDALVFARRVEDVGDDENENEDTKSEASSIIVVGDEDDALGFHTVARIPKTQAAAFTMRVRERITVDLGASLKAAS